MGRQSESLPLAAAGAAHSCVVKYSGLFPATSACEMGWYLHEAWFSERQFVQ